MRARSADFPRGSLALGRPRLHSEQSVSGGVIESRVPAESRVAADELLVRYRPASRTRLLGRIRAQPSLRLVGALTELPVVLVRARPRDRSRMMRWLRAVPGVVSVERDMVESADAVQCRPPPGCAVPNDPGLAYQWYLDNGPGAVQPPGSDAPIEGADVDALHAWAVTRGSAAVRLAIVDTGIDASHPDLAGKVVAAANFTASATTQDLSGHGTHVAGIAAASYDNATGIAGVAPNARLMDVKVLAVDQDGRTSGDCADVADGIVWATDHGANVLNLSLGSASPCQALALATAYAASHGALVVAAAGNNGSTARQYPAALANVLSVAATTNRDELASFSNRGADWVDVAAPGEEIVSTLPTYDNATGAVGYGYLSGTSMAAPVVAGIAALVWGTAPAGATAAGVEARIAATAAHIPGTGSLWRDGRVDACLAAAPSAALCAGLPPEPPPAPSPPVPPPPVTAQPAPLPAPPPTQAQRPAAPGTYSGLLPGRGRLQLVVGDGGDALIGVRATLRLRCGGQRGARATVAALSTIRFGRIRPGGGFAIRVHRVRTSLRRPRLQVAGFFAPASGRARGTLRVTGRASRRAGCDSRVLKWSARG